MSRIHQIALSAVTAFAIAVPAWAQLPVTTADIQRLQDSLTQAATELQQFRGRDSRGTDLQAQYDDLRDEVIYLRVRLRREGSVPRSEYADIRDRVDDLRSRASLGAPRAAVPAPPPAAPAPPRAAARAGGEVPVGTEIDVRLQSPLNSGTAAVEDRFDGTTLVDLLADGRVLIPAGSVMRGVVTSVEPATRTNRTARMTVSFDQVTVNGRAYPMRGIVTDTIQGEGIRGEAGRAGVGAGVGAVIGGLLGGVKGAIAGILIGGGGTIAATEGKQVELAAGTVVRVRFDSALQVNGR